MPNYLFANEKLYTISFHAEEEMEQDDISVADIEDVLEDADSVEVSRSSGANIYRKMIRGRELAVVVNDERNVIVTAYRIAL